MLPLARCRFDPADMALRGRIGSIRFSCPVDGRLDELRYPFWCARIPYRGTPAEFRADSPLFTVEQWKLETLCRHCRFRPGLRDGVHAASQFEPGAP